MTIKTRHPVRSLLALAAVLTLPAVAAKAGSVETTVDRSKSPKEVIQRPERKPKFFMTLGGGAEFDEHATKWISNGGGYLATRPIADLGFGPQSVNLPVKITSKDFHNTHEYPIIARAEAGYQITDWLAVFGGFTYEHSHGDQRVRLGQVRDPSGLVGPSTAVYNLYANVGDYESYTGRAGLKLAMPRTILDFVHAPRAIKPYVTYSAGGKFIEPSKVQFFSPDVLDTGKLKLYNSSWVFTNEVQFGYEVDFTRNFGVFLESGYGYDTKPEPSQSSRSTEGVGLVGTNKGGDRLYSTVNLSAKVMF